MHFWDYHALAKDFKEHRMTAKEKVKYLIAIMLYIPTGLFGSNWIPGIYRLLYRVANDVALMQSTKIPPLKVYSDYNYLTDLAIMAIVAVGVMMCFWANRRGDGKFFVERFMCLSVPVSIRISFYVLIIFLAAMGASLVYFFFKLQLIATLKGFFKAFKQLHHLKELAPLMRYISFRMHIFSSVISLLSLVWSFLILRREILFVSGARDTRSSV